MLLHLVLAAKRGADDHGLEMMAVTGHVDEFAFEALLNIGFDLFGSYHV